ncbi:MAG: YjgN family protein [Firmicutes bacterium]|nr:YjgN family protein [Bacillota bacterium]
MSYTKDSRFTGGLMMWIWVNFVYIASIVFSAGLLMPFGLCYREKWITKHTYIEGKQLEFYGRATTLFLRKAFFIIFGPMIIGLAIGLFFAIFGSYIGGDSDIPILGTTLFPLITALVFALFTAWIARRMKKWVVKHTRFAK